MLYFPDDVLTELPIEIRHKISRYVFNDIKLQIQKKLKFHFYGRWSWGHPVVVVYFARSSVFAKGSRPCQVIVFYSEKHYKELHKK